MSNLLTITTDFGDQFAAAQLKAVIYSLGFEGKFIENHSISPFSIIEGAFEIEVLARFCPNEVVHLGIIDPGVGSSRRPITFHYNYTYNHSNHCGWYVGPDNSLGSGLLEKASQISAWELNPSYFQPISNTFHGRDFFVKAAVYLAQNKRPEDFGSIQIHSRSLEKLTISKGQIVHIDHYGNIKIHYPHKIKGSKYYVASIKNKDYKIPVAKTFSDVPVGTPLVYWGSSDTLELAINLGSAQNHFGASLGDIIKISYEN